MANGDQCREGTDQTTPVGHTRQKRGTRAGMAGFMLALGALANTACQEVEDHHPVVSGDCASCHLDEFAEATNPLHVGVMPETCEDCHSEKFWSPAPGFSHEWPLTGAHGAAQCSSCHTGEPVVFANTPEECIGCHRDDRDQVTQPNHSAFPEECQTCHTTDAWSPATLVGSAARFVHPWPLEGEHAAAPCSSCHVGDPPVYDGTPTECIDCHSDDRDNVISPDHSDFSTNCSECHSDQGWKPVSIGPSFQHTWPLNGVHAMTSCGDCHTGEPPVYEGTPTECIDCHSDDRNNVASPDHSDFSTNCAECHSNNGWKPASIGPSFKHSWPLNGVHAMTSCSDCHTGEPPVYEGTPTECIDCHGDDRNNVASPDHSNFSTNCAECHSNDGWKPASIGPNFVHSWPLNGVHAMTSCGDCHTGEPPVYEGTPTECIDCHDDDRAGAALDHSGFSTNCSECHSNDGWRPASIGPSFQHPWPLTGAHASTSCASCHTGDPPVYDNAPEECVGCHRDDYDRSPYPGHSDFPTTCADCHSTSGWKPASGGLHPDAQFRISSGRHSGFACNDCHKPELGPNGAGNTDCVNCHTGVHSRARMDREHNDVGNYPRGDAPVNFCLNCHRDGRAEDD